MKIAISARQPALDAPVDPRFGRCPYFVIVDTDTGEHETLENSAAIAGGGAGIQAGQMVANQGAEVVLTGHLGPNAFQTLSAAGLTLVTDVTGTVQEAVEQYQSGQCQTTDGPTVADRAGMSGAPTPETSTVPGTVGRGRGGQGRGMGAGRGRRSGMGGGRGGGSGQGRGGGRGQGCCGGRN